MFGRLSPHSLQIGLLLRQLHHSQSGSVTPKVSIVMLAMMAMFDALSTVFHVSLSILIQDLFSAFLTIVFFSVLIFAVLELKYMAIIMTGRAPDQSPERTRQEVRFARYLHRTAPHRTDRRRNSFYSTVTDVTKQSHTRNAPVADHISPRSVLWRVRVHYAPLLPIQGNQLRSIFFHHVSGIVLGPSNPPQCRNGMPKASPQTLHNRYELDASILSSVYIRCPRKFPFCGISLGC